MKANTIINKLIELKGVKKSNLAIRLGISRQALNSRLGQDNISVDLLNDILSELDYKIVVMPKEGRLPKDAYEVE